MTDQSEVLEIESDCDSIDDIYEVEKILDAKKKDGTMFYKVRWEGYGSEEDSWEPIDNLLTCQELVDNYWEQKKGCKKRGRKPKRFKQMTENDSGTSDTDEGRKDQSDQSSEMALPDQKRKRGRPPKHRIVLETDSENQSQGQESSSSAESRGQTLTKRRRKRRSIDERMSSQLSADILLLDCEVAPLGMTRQASKELALVSIRKKQDGEIATSSNLEVRTPLQRGASFSELEQKWKSENTERENDICKKDNFEVIEISSQSTDDEEPRTSSQESRPMVNECIIISSQSDSESETKTTVGKTAFDTSMRSVKKKNSGQQLTQEPLSENNGKDKEQGSANNDASEPLKGLANLKRTSRLDSFSPIDLNLKNNHKALWQISEIEHKMDSICNTVMDSESLEIGDLHEHTTDENSNQVPSSFSPQTGSRVSETKSEAFSDKLAHEKNSKSSEDYITSKVEQNWEEPQGTTCNNDSNVSVTSASLRENSGGKDFAVTTDTAANSGEKVNKDMQSTVTKRLGDQDGIASSPKKRKEKIDANNRFIAKARRTDGRPKSVRDCRTKRSSVDGSPGIPRDSAASRITAISRREAGKTERQIMASTTADLLPMQNKTKAMPLMDGDLIGMIIQDNGKIDESKKTQTALQPGRKEEKTKKNSGSETDKCKPWDSGMEDISDGEDDLSDFEFDLDDYSPGSFFNDVEESKVIERADSPVVEPLHLSLAALKQAIREGDIALVRGALAVPGLNPDTVDTASGMSLLTWAATYGQDDIVKLLLRRGAGINYFDPKRNAITALMQSAEQGFPKTVQILLESGAHINSQTTAGETALMRACKKGHKEVVEILLRHGVDTKTQSTHELTAKQIALKNKHFEIQNLLSDHEKSLSSTLQVALRKCLGTAGTLCVPLLMPYRCIAPGEKDSVTFPVNYNPDKAPQASKVALFCVRADFNGDEVCLSFGGDNGVRSVLFNDSIQYPLVQGNRSVYLLTPDAEASDNALIVQTHSLKNTRLIVCVAYVTATSES